MATDKGTFYPLSVACDPSPETWRRLFICSHTLESEKTWLWAYFRSRIAKAETSSCVVTPCRSSGSCDMKKNSYVRIWGANPCPHHLRAAHEPTLPLTYNNIILCFFIQWESEGNGKTPLCEYRYAHLGRCPGCQIKFCRSKINAEGEQTESYE